MRASDVPAGARLRARHRNNPKGTWRTLASLDERRPGVDVVEVFKVVWIPHYELGVPPSKVEKWEVVEFPRGGVRPGAGSGGARPGAGRKPAQNKEEKEKGKKIQSSVDT